MPRITAAQAQELIAKDDALVVDVREASEVQQSGKVAGAVHVPRGMLEFVADPESPYHDPRFEKGKTVIVYCASGGRSALAGQALDPGAHRGPHSIRVALSPAWPPSTSANTNITSYEEVVT